MGWYIQYTLFVYIRRSSDYRVYYPKSEAEIVSLVRESYVDRGKIRVIGSKHSVCPY